MCGIGKMDTKTTSVTMKLDYVLNICIYVCVHARSPNTDTIPSLVMNTTKRAYVIT